MITMKVYIAEFRPKDLNRIPLFWKLVLDIVGTNYYHSGMLIGNRYFEMYEKGFRTLPFESFEQLNATRGMQDANKYNAGDSIDFIEVPIELSPFQAHQCIEWWEDKIARKVGYGYLRFVELIFWRLFRKISEWYYNKTGHVLLFAKTVAQRSVMVCSSAYDECFKSIGIDLYPGYDETYTVPGLSTFYFPIIYKT